MTTPQAPLPKRRPLRTREELLQAGRQRAGDMQSASEPADRLAALLMLAFPAKPSGAGPPDASTSEDGPDRWLSLGPAKRHVFFTITGKNSLRGNVALDIKGGLLYGIVTTTNGGKTFSGKVTGGTGAFRGATGTITAKAITSTKTAVTIIYS